jgi:hypothetical protein
MIYFFPEIEGSQGFNTEDEGSKNCGLRIAEFFTPNSELTTPNYLFCIPHLREPLDPRILEPYFFVILPVI